MKFTYIFEAIALEDIALSVFLQKDLKTTYLVQFVRYLDTLKLKIEKSVVSHPNGEGYIIYPSEKVMTLLGSNHLQMFEG